jgi:hypothetical protein
MSVLEKLKNGNIGVYWVMHTTMPGIYSIIHRLQTNKIVSGIVGHNICKDGNSNRILPLGLLFQEKFCSKIKGIIFFLIK